MRKLKDNGVWKRFEIFSFLSHFGVLGGWYVKDKVVIFGCLIIILVCDAVECICQKIDEIKEEKDG